MKPSNYHFPLELFLFLFFFKMKMLKKCGLPRMKIRKQQPPDDFPRPRCTEEKFVSTHFYLVLNAQSKQANDENENGGDKAGR